MENNKQATLTLSSIIVIFLFLLQFIPRTSDLKTIAIFLLFFVLVVSTGRIKMVPVPFHMWVYFLVMIFCLIIHYYSGSLRAIAVFLAGFVLTRYIILTRVRTADDFQKILSTVIVLFTLYALLCLFEAFTRINVFDRLFRRTVVLGMGANNVRYGILRPHGVCTISINNAMLVGMIWILSAYRLLTAARHRFFWTMCWGILGIAVILHLSRAVLLVTLVVQGVFLFRSGFRKLVKWLAIGAVVVFLLFIVFQNYMTGFAGIFKALIQSVLSVFEAEGGQYLDRSQGVGGIGNRLQLWRWVYEAVEGQYLFGVGYETPFAKLVQYTTRNGYWLKTSIEVHWLYVFYQTGLFGVFGVLTYMLGAMIHALRNKAEMGEGVLPFPYVMRWLIIGYIFFLFSCSGFEDLYLFYMIVNLEEAYERIWKRDRLQRLQS